MNEKEIWLKEQIEYEFYDSLDMELHYLISQIRFKYDIEPDDEHRIIEEALTSVLRRLIDDVYYSKYR